MLRWSEPLARMGSCCPGNCEVQNTAGVLREISRLSCVPGGDLALEGSPGTVRFGADQ